MRSQTRWMWVFVAAVALPVSPLPLAGQSSSLYMQALEPQPVVVIDGVAPNRLSPAVAQASLAAVYVPPPRQFAVHDLITIVVRERIENDAQASIDTSKDTELSGSINAFPNLRISDLLNLRLTPSQMVNGTPEVDIESERAFTGDGDYSRRDSFTTRVTARIIDIKPNGTLVLEARKFIKSDKEALTLIVTGTCRKQDVKADNTILSTQIYDLRLVKKHEGELRKATKKGWFTKVLDGLFNF